MKPEEMTAEKLLSEMASAFVEPGWSLAEDCKQRHLYDEVKRRLTATEAQSEETRSKLVERFAHSATTAVVGLWMAHGGRPVESNEAPDLAKCLFEFFSKIR